MGDHFFGGFGEELVKLAQQPGLWQKFKSWIGVKKPVPAPQPKFKPGSGYKPAPKKLAIQPVGGATRSAQQVRKYLP
jgi:hypothetical protein